MHLSDLGAETAGDKGMQTSVQGNMPAVMIYDPRPNPPRSRSSLHRLSSGRIPGSHDERLRGITALATD